jgi:TonB-dependent SusC/RagA subfamily outer membrane receptor
MGRHVLAAATLGCLGCAYPAASLAPLGAPPGPGCGLLTLPERITASAASTLCAEELSGIPVVQIEELIESRVPGVWAVRLASGSVSLRLWGPSTVYGDNEPLYVLDGMPLQMTPGRGLNWLNPADIQRIEILKDVSALAIYGVRGANGVVLITTRRGKRQPH